MSKNTYCALDKCEFEVYEKNDFAVIKGSYTVPAGDGTTSGSITTQLDYPKGFTAENTIVLSIGVKKTTSSDYIYEVAASTESMAYIRGFLNGDVKLTSSKIEIKANNVSKNAQSYDYKLLIMKVD